MKYRQITRVIAAYNFKKGIVKNYNQRELAKLFEIKEMTFCSYKRRGNISDSKIINFAKKHKLDLNYIYEVERV